MDRRAPYSLHFCHKHRQGCVSRQSLPDDFVEMSNTSWLPSSGNCYKRSDSRNIAPSAVTCQRLYTSIFHPFLPEHRTESQTQRVSVAMCVIKSHFASPDVHADDPWHAPRAVPPEILKLKEERGEPATSDCACVPRAPETSPALTSPPS